jgi:hypothetical protein
MRHTEPISEDEMIAVFLRTEIASTRFAQGILAILTREGYPQSIIEQPNLDDPRENAYRRKVLGEWRGYGRNADVFGDFPPNVRWYRATIEKRELATLRYINDDYWIELSGGSRLAVDAAVRIRQGIKAFEVDNGGFWRMAEALCAGAIFPELILVGRDEQAQLVVLEGHARLTAYCLRPDCIPATLTVLVGYAPQMDKCVEADFDGHYLP